MKEDALQQDPDDAAQHDAAHWNLRERARLAGLAAAAVVGVYLTVGLAGVDVPVPAALAGWSSAPGAPVRVSSPKAGPRATQRPDAPTRGARNTRGRATPRSAHGRFEHGGTRATVPAATPGPVGPAPQPPSAPPPPKPAAPSPKGATPAPAPAPTPPPPVTDPPQLPALPAVPPPLPVSPPPLPVPVPTTPTVTVSDVPPLSPPSLPTP